MALPTTTITLNIDNLDGLYSNTITYDGTSFKLNVSQTLNGGMNSYSRTGTVEFPYIDLGQFYLSITSINITSNLAGGAVTVFTSTSNDAVNFSPYVPLNIDKTIASPQGRYIKIKVQIDGLLEIKDNVRSSFSSEESSQFSGVDETVIFNGELKLKNLYSYEMSRDSSITEGKLFTAQLNKNLFKKIDSIEVI